MSKVLVLDGKSIATIAIVRSLAKHEIEVTCGEEFRACPAFFSKYVKKGIVYPSPEKNPDLFIEKIHDLVKNNNYDLVMPVADETTVLLSQYKRELSKFTRIPTPDYDTVMKGRDKARTIKVALENGIPCPKTYFPEVQSLDEIRDSVEYPVLIRPCQSSGARGIRFVDSPERLADEYERVSKLYGQAFIQEYIPNEEGRYNLSALFKQNAEPRAVCVIKGIRSYPLNSGPWSIAQTTENPNILEYGSKLLHALNWYGVACVEFLIDRRDGKPKLMEVNPRFWNAVALDIESGVDFPYMLYKMVVDGDVTPNYSYRSDAKWRWLLPQDILWLFSPPHEWGKVKDFLKFRDKDLHYAVLSRSDPGPTIGIIFQSLKFLASKEKRDFMFNRGWSTK